MILSAAAAMAAKGSPASGSGPTLCVFSKHLAEIPYRDLGKASKDLGFDGVDLTVRAKGHVLPEKAAQDLPRAYEAIRTAGLAVPMITTELIEPSDPTARPILQTAGGLKIPFWKPGYRRYSDKEDPLATLAKATTAYRGLAAIAREYGIVTGLHNHSGNYVGVAVWDLREILSALDPKFAGYYYDPCHAVAEGGLYNWELSLRIASPSLKMVAVKDFFWEKQGGEWTKVYAPLGEGMVNWKKFFTLLKAAKFTGPITVHQEYKSSEPHKALAKDAAFMQRHLV